MLSEYKLCVVSAMFKRYIQLIYFEKNINVHYER